jgi:hypothetical protein
MFRRNISLTFSGSKISQQLTSMLAGAKQNKPLLRTGEKGKRKGEWGGSPFSWKIEAKCSREILVHV